MKRLDRILYISFMAAIGAVMLALLAIAYFLLFNGQKETTETLGKIVLCTGLSLAGLATVNMTIYLIKYTGRKK